jgi:hypothetical protein
MGLKGCRLWVMGQLDSTCRAPPQRRALVQQAVERQAVARLLDGAELHEAEQLLAVNVRRHHAAADAPGRPRRLHRLLHEGLERRLVHLGGDATQVHAPRVPRGLHVDAGGLQSGELRRRLLLRQDAPVQVHALGGAGEVRRGVGLQVAFERQTLKPVFSLYRL